MMQMAKDGSEAIQLDTWDEECTQFISFCSCCRSNVSRNLPDFAESWKQLFLVQMILTNLVS